MTQTSVQSKQGKMQLSFNFGMAAFEVVIGQNFRSIQETLAKQQAQITRLTSLFEGFQRNINVIPKQDHEKESIQGGKKEEEGSSPTTNQGINDDKTQKKQQQTINSPQKQTQTKQPIYQTQGNNTIISTIPIFQAEIAMLPHQSQLNQTDLSLSEVGVKLINSDIMEQKVFQLFQRVRQLEEKQSNSERFSLKKFREVDFQMQQTSQSIEKSRKAMEQFDDTVESLRNQISEYKLKKESKIMKALNSSSINLNQTSTGENYDYMAEKLQFLLKHVSELMTKKSFEDEREAIHQSIDNLRRKMNDNINETFFQQSMKAQQARIYQSVAKHIKALQFSPHEKGTADELDSIIEQGNRQFLQRVSEHEQKIKVIGEQLTLLKGAVDGNRKERVQFQDECLDQIRLTQQKCEMLGVQIEDTQKYIQEVKQSLSEKHLQSQNQIIQLQESLDKVTSNFKTLAFAANNKDNLLRTSYTPNDNPESQPALQKVGSNIELENDLKSQQKKFNKLHGKVQGLKEDILVFREDLMREIDGLKAGIEKKADWESLKKGLNYFDEKLKETKAVTQALYENTGKEEGDSLAVKKGWTCLVCDKDIKNYQGKLSELKFTSLFPVRESPRIGGYYKQQQASQEYRQVFLSNSNLNNRNRRIGSLKSKQSKEELH